MTTSALQAALKARGFDPGPIDGIFGRRTIAAVKAFQAANGLEVDGIAGPKTMAALALGKVAVAMRGDDTLLPWMEEARRRKGLHESRNKSTLWAWLKSDKGTVGDPTKVPWCGDFVETSIALTLPDEPLPNNPYLARNWLKFGQPCEPIVGAVLVFWRGSKSGTSGHVGFYVGEDSAAFRVLGGNQSNSVSETRIAKNRLLGARWPKTFPLSSRRVVTSASGALSTNEA